MGHTIILKRSALAGKAPTTASLELGELAINTYDGKVFLRSSGVSDEIKELVTTNTINTGSITLTKTGSFGEIIASQDINVGRDVFVIRDIVVNGDIDTGGDISGSGLQINDTLNITHNVFKLSASAEITGSLNISMGSTPILSVSASAINITSASVTRNFMHLTKYITVDGHLDFNI